MSATESLKETLKELIHNYPIIDFTDSFSGEEDHKKYFYFDWYSTEVERTIRHLQKHTETPNSPLIIADYGISLGKAKPEQPKQVLKVIRDHLNLSTLNPLLTPIKDDSNPRFFAVNDLYLCPEKLKNKFPEAIIAGLNSLAEPNKEESMIMKQAGATDYSYDFVLAALVAANCGFKVIGLLLSEYPDN